MFSLYVTPFRGLVRTSQTFLLLTPSDRGGGACKYRKIRAQPGKFGDWLLLLCPVGESFYLRLRCLYRFLDASPVQLYFPMYTKYLLVLSFTTQNFSHFHF
jgi:hypothetical protein